MKAVGDTLEIARSNLVEQAKRGGSRSRPQYRKAGDAELFARMRPLVDARPSHGYRRITALLNRQAEAEGLARANHKRVYCVMKRTGLLPARTPGVDANDRMTVRLRRPPRTGAGPRTFEIPCWNGDAVRVAFAIDTHDARSSPRPPARAASAGSPYATSCCS
jgi:hypothetical protein